MSSKYRVLLVDDEPSLLSSMSAILSWNFTVSTCDSASVALRMLAPTSSESVPYHVVCADWKMPAMDGVEFFRQLSGHADWPSISCILMSERVDELLEQVAWADRKTLGVVRKPFDPDQLVARVEHYAHLTEMKLSVQNMRTSSGKWRLK